MQGYPAAACRGSLGRTPGNCLPRARLRRPVCQVRGFARRDRRRIGHGGCATGLTHWAGRVAELGLIFVTADGVQICVTGPLWRCKTCHY